MAHAVSEHEPLLERCREALAGKPFGAGKPPALQLRDDGCVWARASELAAALAVVTGERWDIGRVRAALAPFRTGRVRYREGDEVVRAWELDTARLREALGE
jgi:hypothetical protein